MELEELETSINYNIGGQDILDTYAFDNRIIYIYGHIDQEMFVSIQKRVHYWNSINTNPIIIYIDSMGGDISACLAIMNVLLNSVAPIHTITIGEGMSCGFYIGLCGSKRACYKYSSFLYHAGSLGDTGDFHKFMQRADFYKKQNAMLEQFVVSRTKITEDLLSSHNKDDWSLTAQEAKDLEIVHEIIGGE